LESVRHLPTLRRSGGRKAAVESTEDGSRRRVNSEAAVMAEMEIRMSDAHSKALRVDLGKAV